MGDALTKSGNKYKFEYKFVLINKDFVFKKIILTTDGTDFTVSKLPAQSFTRWPLAASHDGLRINTRC